MQKYIFRGTCFPQRLGAGGSIGGPNRERAGGVAKIFGCAGRCGRMGGERAGGLASAAERCERTAVQV